MKSVVFRSFRADRAVWNQPLPPGRPFLGSRLNFLLGIMLSLVTLMFAFTAPPTAANGMVDANAGSRAMVTQFSLMLVIGVVFWLLTIRPQQKKAREQAALLKQLKRNDKVTTSAGLCGTVVNVKDNTVTLRSGESTLEVTKVSIVDVTERASS